MGCADLGEEVEKFLRDALEGEPRARVEAHLATCADCRGYVDAARRIERELSAHLAAPLPDDSERRWRAVERKLAERDVAIARLPRWSLIALAIGAVVAAIPHQSLEDRALAFGSMVLFAAILLMVRTTEIAVRHKLREPSFNVIRWARLSATVELVGMSAMTAIFAFCAFELGTWAMSDRFTNPSRAMFALLTACLAIGATLFALRIPGTRRELRELR